MAISKRLRYEILRRDGFKCRYCHASEALLTIDHVTPVTLGGTDHPTNLVASCDECNSGKTSVLPGGGTVAEVDEDDLRWARAIKKAAARARGRRDAMDRYRSTFRDAWDRWHHGENQTRFPLPAAWGTSIDQFYEADLPVSAWPEIVELAMASRAIRDRFDGACGIAWKKVAELRHAARGLAEGAGAANDAEDEIVIDAAVHVWRTYWMPEHQMEPPPDVEAEFRADAKAYFDDYGADDLLRIARTCAEEGISDLAEALEYAQMQDAEGEEDQWDRARIFDTWIEQWHASAPEWPLPDLDAQDVFHAHASAALAAGYDGVSVGYAAHKAGQAHTARLADHLESAQDILRQRAEWRARRAALAQSATRLWLDSFAKATGGDQPVKADIETFTQHVASRVGRNSEEYILQAAQHAGAELNYTIDRYLPAEQEVPF